MKKFLSLQMALLLLLGALFCVPASAASNSDGSFYYEKDGDYYSVTSVSSSLSGAITIPAEYKGLPVKKIGSYAFERNSAITEITLSDNITDIYEAAFQDCSSLKKVKGGKKLEYIDDGAFFGCKMLESIYISQTVNRIGSMAFRHCSKLKKISLNDGMKIHSRAFDDSGIYNTKSNWKNNLFYIDNYFICAKENIKGKISIKEGIEYTSECTFLNNDKITGITFPDSLKEIGKEFLYNCNKIESIIIPDNVSVIGSNAFTISGGLKSVVLGKNVKTVANGVFSNCYNLTSVKFNSKLRTLGNMAFINCSKLESVKLPASLKTIGSKAFYGCDRLSKITIPSGINRISSNAFDETNYYYNEANWESGVLYIGTNLIRADEAINTNYTIKSGTKLIASGAFKNCTKLKAVIIPDTVDYIPNSAFYGCSKLSFIKIPDSVTKIGGYAFYNCRNLSAVSIPGTVETIEDRAFYSMKALYIPKTVKALEGRVVGKSTVVYGVSGSAAEEYCSSKGNDFISTKKHKHSYIEVEHSVKSVNTPGIKFKKCDKCGRLISFKTEKQLTPATVKLTKITNKNYGVQLEWKKTAGADSYKIYRKVNSGKSWTYVTTISDSTTYVDYNAKNNTKYTYTVRARNEGGSGSYNKTGLTTVFVSAPAPTKLENTTSGIKVTWKKVSGADNYYLYKKELTDSSAKWVKVSKLKGNVTSYVDEDVKSGKDYAYEMRATNGSYKSDTTEVCDIPFIKRLKTPTAKSIASSKSGVTVKWGKVTGADGYYVYRKTGSGEYSKIATVEGNSKVSYLDKSAKKGKTYTYKIRAYSGVASSKSASSKTLKITDKY